MIAAFLAWVVLAQQVVQEPGPSGLPPFEPTPVAGDARDVQVSSPSGADQNETVICVDPTDPSHLIGGANDSRNGPISTAFYSSFDGGRNWSELIYQSQEYLYAGDPAAAFGPNGEVYFSALELPNFNYTTSSLYVGRSLDGGLTVPSWTRVFGMQGVFADRQLLEADTSNGPLRGNLYLTFTRFRNNLTENPIVVSSSSDQGQTWSSPKRLSDSLNCQVSKPAIGPNSELYVTFVQFGGNNRVMIDRSLDGGLTWGEDVLVGFADGTLPNAPFFHFSAPYCDVDRSGGPYNGTVYVVFTDYIPSEGGTDVVLYRSTDGAQTFSGPIAVSDEPAGTSEFFPFVDVDPLGNVNVGYFDRRGNDIDIGYRVSRSSDGGQTFGESYRVSDTVFDPYSYAQGGWIGDYGGLAASDQAVHPLWTDGRNGTNDIFTSRVPLSFLSDQDLSAAGGRVEFQLSPGPALQGADFVLFGSGVWTDWGNGVPFTPRLRYVAGTLDETGSATVALDSGGPLDPGSIGTTMHFKAWVHSDGELAWTSGRRAVKIVP